MLDRRLAQEPPPGDIDSALLGEAADWLVRFQSGDDSARTRRAFEQWHAQSPAHAAAWRRAEMVLDTFHRVPAEVGRRALGGLARPGRRRALSALGLAAVATPAAWLAWRHQPWTSWRADLATAPGEQRHLTLDDGTNLVLDTATAVDVAFTAGERRLRLIRGEILVTTAKDPAPRPRPFLVETAEGRLRPLGTRFSVRQGANESHVAVFEGAVEVLTTGGAQRTLGAGEQAAFRVDHIGEAAPADASTALWAKGMLVARDLPLAALLAELARYRPGVLRCHPAVAELRVSGAFPLTDVDASLELLVKTRPLVVRRLTRYWLSVEPRVGVLPRAPSHVD